MRGLECNHDFVPPQFDSNKHSINQSLYTDIYIAITVQGRIRLTQVNIHLLD